MLRLVKIVGDERIQQGEYCECQALLNPKYIDLIGDLKYQHACCYSDKYISQKRN